MNNFECVVAVLSAHRDARAWADHAVANDLLEQLGLDPEADAKNAKPVIDPNMLTEDQVKAAEDAADVAVKKAKEAREALSKQEHNEVDAEEQQRKAAAVERDAEVAREEQARTDSNRAQMAAQGQSVPPGPQY